MLRFRLKCLWYGYPVEPLTFIKYAGCFFFHLVKLDDTDVLKASEILCNPIGIKLKSIDSFIIIYILPSERFLKLVFISGIYTHI